MKKPNVALVYDRVNKFGGAERVLMAMHEIWPEAPLFTAVYDAKKASWARGFTVNPTFLQRFPFAVSHHELYAWLTPIAFESLMFDGYDIVISITSAEAKYIITKPNALHICYCLTPTRYLWSGYDAYAANPSMGLPNWMASVGLRALVSTLRKWDIAGSSRPDAYIAISELVAQRITTYYKRPVERVIYPPANVHFFTSRKKKKHMSDSSGYFLVVSRLVGYKRIDIIVDAFNALGWPLVIVGEGREKDALVRRAKNNIRFVNSLTDRELAYYYEHSRAFVFAGVEDFGIVAVEAQASGIPVIAYKKSGLSEIVIPGITGELFEEQTVPSLIASLNLFASQWYDSASCVRNAQRFSKERFQREMKDTVDRLYNTYI